jgi:hypothetical protein
MSEITSQENAIILAAARKMVSLGSEASQKNVIGHESIDEDAKGELILRLLTAYRKKASLSDKQLEAILFCLRKLSGSSVFPTVEPIVGQANNYVQIVLESDGSALLEFFTSGSTIGSASELNFAEGLEASLSGDRVTARPSDGTMIFQGDWDGSTNLVPTAGITQATIRKGYFWNNTANTTTLLGPDGGIIPAGYMLMALVNSPGADPADTTKWRIIAGIN